MMSLWLHIDQATRYATRVSESVGGSEPHMSMRVATDGAAVFVILSQDPKALRRLAEELTGAADDLETAIEEHDSRPETGDDERVVAMAEVRR